MITIDDAFRKFRSRLELTDREQEDASRRQIEIRSFLEECFEVDDSFLTGSYRRWTKTKPLRDVDIFCVLGATERKRRGEQPSKLLAEFESALKSKFKDRAAARTQRRSVSLDFGPSSEEDERVMSFDVVPAFAKEGHYEIPDVTHPSGWIATNPKVHEEKALAANRAFSGEWRGFVRMLKKWNANQGKPIRPSFLIEVMALDLLRPPFGGDFAREMKAFFAAASDRVDDEWPDPAGLGPKVSDAMNAGSRAEAKAKLRTAMDAATQAIQMASAGRTEAALQVWRDRVFGLWFPLS